MFFKALDSFSQAQPVSVPVGDFNVIAKDIQYIVVLQYSVYPLPMSILSYSENFEPLAASESNRTSKIGRFQIAGGRHLTLLQFMDTHQLLLQFFAVHLCQGQRKNQQNTRSIATKLC